MVNGYLIFFADDCGVEIIFSGGAGRFYGVTIGLAYSCQSSTPTDLVFADTPRFGPFLDSGRAFLGVGRAFLGVGRAFFGYGKADFFIPAI